PLYQVIRPATALHSVGQADEPGADDVLPVLFAHVTAFASTCREPEPGEEVLDPPLDADGGRRSGGQEAELLAVDALVVGSLHGAQEGLLRVVARHAFT